MVVVRGFLHQVYRRPTQGKRDDAKAVSVPQGDHYPQASHEQEIQVHPRSRKGLQPFKTNKAKGKFWIYQVGLHPTGKNGAVTLQAYKYTKENPENNQLAIVYPAK